MAQAKVYPPQYDVFNPPIFNGSGWSQTFPVIIHGTELPERIATEVNIAFLNGDGAVVMDNKIRDGVIAAGATMGISVGTVISFAPPRRM